MDNYLSIGDVSRISGVGIKALRYYDKMGVFTPAYVNPESGYRYYRHEQLMQLDLVLLCLEAGVSLSTMRQYILPDGSIEAQGLFSLCLSHAQKKIANLTRKAGHLAYGLKLMDEYYNHESSSGICLKHFPQRQIFVVNRNELNQQHDTPTLQWEQINVLAAQENVDITYPCGSIHIKCSHSDEKYLFMEAHSSSGDNPHLRCLTAGTYRCLRTYDCSSQDELRLFYGHIPDTYQLAAVQIMTPNMNYRHPLFELQYPEDAGFDIFTD